MYVRYLMWNFVGRQNDIQRYDSQDGNWMSGIKFMDELHLGSARHQKMYYKIRAKHLLFFPFLLGLIGLMYHANKDRKVLCTIDSYSPVLH
jgi:hypothetical protein